MKTKKITTGAMMTALATVLMYVSKFIPLPFLQGGSITLGSMVPIIVFSMLYGTKWGLLCAFVFSLIQMTTGVSAPPTGTFFAYVLVILLDYVIAYTVLGLSGKIYEITGKKKLSAPISGAIVCVMRYLCHVISGVVIWGVYAKGNSVILYSLVYNASYMLPETVITAVILFLLGKFIKDRAELN